MSGGPGDIPGIIAGLDRYSGSRLEDERERLIPAGRAIVPHLAWGLGVLRKQGSRVALLYTAVKFARVEPDAVDAAIAALSDRGAQVRCVACALLAFSLQDRALPALHAREAIEPRADIRADIAAAVAAISRRNHHLWIDRNGWGGRWNVVGAVYPDSGEGG